MLEVLRGASKWRLHPKDYNFQWYPLPNYLSSEYPTAPKLWHVVCILFFYDIAISWLNLLNGKGFFFTCVILKLTCVTWKSPITNLFLFLTPQSWILFLLWIIFGEIILGRSSENLTVLFSLLLVIMSEQRSPCFPIKPFCLIGKEKKSYGLGMRIGFLYFLF